MTTVWQERERNQREKDGKRERRKGKKKRGRREKSVEEEICTALEIRIDRGK